MNPKSTLTLNPRVSIFNHNGGVYLFDPSTRTYASMKEPMLASLIHHDSANSSNTLSDKESGELSDIRQKLLKAGILVLPGFADESDKNSNSPRSDVTTNLTLFVTTKCNLRCSYCYANGGDSDKTIRKDIWQTAMNHFFSSLRTGMADGKVHSKSIRLAIHGGGEPTTEFATVKEIVTEFRERAKVLGLQSSVSMGTNGTYNDFVHRWILENDIHVNISLDGPRDIQNSLRPFRSGLPSYDTVVHNLQGLVKAGRHVSVRATVTGESLKTMEDTVEVARHIGLAAVHFEPVSLTGRGAVTSVTRPDAGSFSEKFLQCFLLGLKHDIDVHYSGMRCFQHSRERFCGACGQNLCYTPDGNITTCYEVLDAGDPAAKEFFIGKVNTARGVVVLDQTRIDRLYQRVTENMEACKECFLRYQCAGDCPARSFRHYNRDLYSPDPYRCEISERINKQLIVWLADGVIDPRNVEQASVFTL